MFFFSQKKGRKKERMTILAYWPANHHIPQGSFSSANSAIFDIICHALSQQGILKNAVPVFNTR